MNKFQKNIILRKGQLDLKSMVIKYAFAIFFVMIALTAFTQMGLIGNITPGGGVKDFGVTGVGITGAVVVEQNQTNVTEGFIDEKPDTGNMITT